MVNLPPLLCARPLSMQDFVMTPLTLLVVGVMTPMTLPTVSMSTGARKTHPSRRAPSPKTFQFSVLLLPLLVSVMMCC